MLKLLLAASVLLPSPVAQAVAPAVSCSAPVAIPATVTAPHSTYYSNDEPPQRFAHIPTRDFKVSFGQDAVDRLCGRPPCGMRFVGCVRDNKIALPDPFTTDPQQFAHTVRHELAHVNGWPATHGD